MGEVGDRRPPRGARHAGGLTERRVRPATPGPTPAGSGPPTTGSTPGDLAGTPFLVGRRRDNPPLHDLVVATLGAPGPPGSPAPATRQVDSLATMAALVLARRGAGVTVADAAAVAACGVAAVPLDAPPVPLSLIWCRENPNPALAAFLDAALPAGVEPRVP